MKFKIIKKKEKKDPKYDVILEIDHWNDYSFETIFAVYFKLANKFEERGAIKIGKKDLDLNKHISIYLPETFNSLDSKFFSIGASVGYYKSILKLSENKRKEYYTALNDLAFKGEIDQEIEQSDVFKKAFLRTTTKLPITGQYHRLATGNDSTERFSLKYVLKELELTFKVEPNQLPSTNLHAIIGDNGAGKTFILNDIVKFYKHSSNSDGELDCDPRSFANMIYISFSAFDDISAETIDHSLIDNFSYVGIKELKTDKSGITDLNQFPHHKGSQDINKEFEDSLKRCVKYKKMNYWYEVIGAFKNNSIYRNYLEPTILLSDDDFITVISESFERFSSGHKIALLVLTKLIEKLEEKSIILFDEPETHLHPPLLSTLIRCISSLVTKKNGIAIISTHSPVVLQEIPSSCVWKVYRNGLYSKAERPQVESFGENLGILTREVFGYELLNTGFYKILSDTVENTQDDYEAIINKFNNELGWEARSLLRSLINQRKNSEED